MYRQGFTWNKAKYICNHINFINITYSQIKYMIALCFHARGLLFDLRGRACDKAAKYAWNNDVRAIFLWIWAALLPKNSSLQYWSKIGCFGAKTMYFITFFERVLGEEKLFPKKIGDKCSTGNIVFPENLAFCGLFSWRILQKFLCPYFTSFSRKNQYFFIFQVDLIETPHDVSFRKSFIRSFGFFF